jgi:hypothetical protein
MKPYHGKELQFDLKLFEGDSSDGRGVYGEQWEGCIWRAFWAALGVDIYPKAFGHLLGWDNRGFAYSNSRGPIFLGVLRRANIDHFGCIILDSGKGRANIVLVLASSSIFTWPKSSTSFWNIHCKITFGTYCTKYRYMDRGFITTSYYDSFKNACSVHPIRLTCICMLSRTLFFTGFFDPPPPSRTSVPTNAPCVLENS